MDLETVTTLLKAISTYGSGVGETMAAKMISTVLPAVGAVMLVWAIVFAIFGRSLGGGGRKFLEAINIFCCLLGTV